MVGKSRCRFRFREHFSPVLKFNFGRAPAFDSDPDPDSVLDAASRPAFNFDSAFGYNSDLGEDVIATLTVAVGSFRRALGRGEGFKNQSPQPEIERLYGGLPSSGKRFYENVPTKSGTFKIRIRAQSIPSAIPTNFSCSRHLYFILISCEQRVTESVSIGFE
ncbi:hypothetical protein EVAR_58899_1 [Eumeta japonica]|uniref:Uncharacterized protein n=1 Tax=Eumeta variegata TaxID=151549 RepID=A0A4C1YW18_EUMVA|nr:hypothetical protein EVAR_58899_1 [Eumeta japonica]